MSRHSDNDPLPSKANEDVTNDEASTLALPKSAGTVSQPDEEIAVTAPTGLEEEINPLPSNANKDLSDNGISPLVLPEPAGTVSQPGQTIIVTAPAVLEKENDPLPSSAEKDVSNDKVSPLVLPGPAGTVSQPDRIITVTAPAVLEKENDPLPSDIDKDVSNDGVSPLILPEPAGTVSQPDEIAIVTAPALSGKENNPLPSNPFKDLSNDGALALAVPKRIRAISQPDEITTVTTPGILKKENEDPRPSIPQLAATPPTSAEPANDQPASNQLATRSLVGTEGERGLVVRKKWKDIIEDEEQVDKENMADRGEHAVGTPNMTLNEVHRSKRASATGSDKPSRVSAGSLNPLDELCQGRSRVDDLPLPDVPYHLGGTDPNGRGEMVEEEPQEHAPSTPEKQQQDEVIISEPAIAAPAPVDNPPMAATPDGLIHVNLEQELASFSCDGQWYRMGLILASTGWEIDSPIGDLPSITSGSSMQEEIDEPGMSVSIHTENREPGPPVGDLPSLPSSSSMQKEVDEPELSALIGTENREPGKRRVSNATAELVERTAKFLRVKMASDFESDKTCSSSLWGIFKNAVRRAIEDCRKGIKDRERKDEPEKSKGKRPIQGASEVSDPKSSMSYITNWSLESPPAQSADCSLEVNTDDSNDMAANERTGMQLWGGFWKNIDIWPDDLMSVSRPVGYTMATWWIVRRQWLMNCARFWSQREKDQVTRITSELVLAGPVYGISMDRWVNDLSKDAVRAKYLHFLS